jgi:hypothetical protein
MYQTCAHNQAIRTLGKPVCSGFSRLKTTCETGAPNAAETGRRFGNLLHTLHKCDTTE